MSDLTEIKKKMDSICEKSKNVNTSEAVNLLFEISNSGNVADVAQYLSKFSTDVLKNFFDRVTENGNYSIGKLDELICELIRTDKNKVRHINGYYFILKRIMEKYKEKSIESVQLPCLAIFISENIKKLTRTNEFLSLISVKSDNDITETEIGILMLNYDNVEHKDLEKIWELVKNVLAKEKGGVRHNQVEGFGKKYGFRNVTNSQQSFTSLKTNVCAVSEFWYNVNVRVGVVYGFNDNLVYEGFTQLIY